MMKYFNSKKNFNLYNYGKHIRDFTYISDVNHIIYRLLKLKNQGHLVLNICSNNPVSITKIISEINKRINKKSLRINKIKLQKADVIKTHGDNSRVKKINLNNYDLVVPLVNHRIFRKEIFKKLKVNKLKFFDVFNFSYTN